jgi:2'-5' RNA ligase
MLSQYFIAAIPDLPKSFYQKINAICGFECYPEFRLPFHVTLFFLGKMNNEQKNRVSEWLNNKKVFSQIKAKSKNVNSFFEKGVPKVYYLKIDSPDLIKINKDLEIFSNIHKDKFEYFPHLSLFYPKRNLTSFENKILKETFEEIKIIKFKFIILGSITEGATRIHISIPVV